MKKDFMAKKKMSKGEFLGNLRIAAAALHSAADSLENIAENYKEDLPQKMQQILEKEIPLPGPKGLAAKQAEKEAMPKTIQAKKVA